MGAPAAIRTIDMRLIDDLFGMNSGYVLDFSDRTFAAFFVEELGINIDESRYSAEGTSKAKRLRYFLKSSPPDLRARTLNALWEYRETQRRRTRSEETFPDAAKEFAALIERISGKKPTPPASAPAAPAPKPVAMSAEVAAKLKATLLATSTLAPQPRGYAYERFLKDLFDANGLRPRAPFNLVGEQIDGSFELSGETYLLEAKWVGPRIGAAELHAFNGKIQNKAAWSRGLFVSDSGFTEEGLTAFGAAKCVVCMDGLDIYDMLDRALWFRDVMARKVRHAAETGSPFEPVRNLF
jgi:hypothetical protein